MKPHFMEWMKRHEVKLINLAIILMFLILVFGVQEVLSVESQINKDDIFKTLKSNDAQRKQAVFTVNNKDNKILNKDSLSINFNEICGEVISYKIEAYQSCPKHRKVFDKTITRCYDVDIKDQDNKTTGTDQICRDRDMFKTETYYELDYCEIEQISTGQKDYKITDVEIKHDNCGDGWGYSIDWIPELTIGSKKYMQNSWAWWNVSFQRARQITIENIYDTDFINYGVNISLDTTDSTFQDDCDDIRILYQNITETNWINSTGCGLNDTLIWFRANVTAQTNNTDYWVFWNNTEAIDVRTNMTDVRGYYDDGTILLWWHLDENSGSHTAVDGFYPSMATLITSPPPLWKDGNDCKFGSCLLFDGVDDWVRGEPQEIGESTLKTYECWVNINSSETDFGTFIGRNEGTSGASDVRGNIFFRTNGDKTQLFMAYGANPNYEGGTSDYSHNEGNWEHVAINVSSNAFTFIVDGIEYNSGSLAQQYNDNTSAGINWSLGAGSVDFSITVSQQQLEGYLDECAVFNGTRTLEQIRHDGLYYNSETALSDVFAFIPNDPPIPISADIVPDSPTTINNLQCYGTFTDDGVLTENMTISFEWYKDDILESNGSLFPAFNNTNTLINTVSSSSTDYGEVWLCNLRAFDGLDFSEWINDSVTVAENDLPIIIDVDLLPDSPTTVQNLTGNVQATDSINLTFNIEFEWYNSTTIFSNGTFLGYSNNSITLIDTLGNINTGAGETWVFNVRAFDGLNFSSWVNDSVIIESEPTTPPTGITLDLTTIEGYFLIFIFIVVWFGMITLGYVFRNPAFAIVGYIVGVLLGFLFVSIQPLITLVLVILNAFMIFVTFKDG